MDQPAQDASGYHVWRPPDKPFVVYLHFDVVDRLSGEAMRGFGAVPKRGAEVGGVLLGSIERGETTTVMIEDCEPVGCSYKRGPSYLLSDEDRAVFEDACQRWQPQSERPAYAVGFFRSQTRDGLALTPEDIEVLDRLFPDAGQVALLIKPQATKVSLGGFFFREEGAFQQATPLEFPFRRRELAGEEPPPRRTLMERTPRYREPRELAPPSPPRWDFAADQDSESFQREALQPEPAYAVTTPSRSRIRKGWVWLPLSTVFLVLGLVLGFEVSLNFRPRPAAPAAAEFSLGLSAAKSEDNLNVRWNREAAAVRAAQKGLLEIDDGGFAKPVDLDMAHLQNGGIIYRNSSKTVRFRLTVYLSERITVVESLEWRE